MLFRKCHLFFLALYEIILTSYTNGENSDKRKFILQGINDFMQLATPVNVSLVRVSFHMELKVISS